MQYPLISEYISAIKDAEDNFATLTNLRPVLDDAGMPVMSSGNFAVVFKMEDISDGKLYAVKCFTKEQKEREERYREIIKELEQMESSYLVPTSYYDCELFVDTKQNNVTEFPVVVMDWIDGICLDEYMRIINDDKEKRELLANNFREFVCWLLPKHFAHGDLKPDNIIVKEDGNVVLVDYDGMYVPSLYGKSALELGTPMFRFKERTLYDFNEYLDDYSTVFLLLILKIGAISPNVIECFLKEGNAFDIFRKCGDFMNDKQIAPIISAYIMVSTYGYLERSLISSLIANRARYDSDMEMKLLSSARQGDTKDMIKLADLYKEGIYVPQNIDKSMKWYDLALKLGNVNASCGFCCNIQKDPDFSSKDFDVLYEKLYQSGCAFVYCRKGELSNDIDNLLKAAEKGFVPALYNLGKGYHSRFEDNDKNKEIEYYVKAAEQGYMPAIYALKRINKKNPADTIKWIIHIANYGYSDAQYNLALCYALGEGVGQDYEKAVYWWKKSAEQGNADAQYNLGICYEYGVGVEQDYEKAVFWYRKSAEQGNASAQNNLGICYAKGDGVEQDYEKAVFWYRKSAEQGNAKAQNNLGVCYKNGEGVEQDYEKAAFWYRKSAEQGDSTAQFNLGYHYAKGDGVEQDYEKAVFWYRKSAEQGNASAQNNLGVCYKNGEGVEQDYEKAAFWYRKSAEQGNEKAQDNLKIIEKIKRETTKINGHEYVDLGLPSGLKWATCNVGANSPEEYGDYYAWGETETKDKYTEENSYTSGVKMNDISGNPQYDVARKKWGGNWRMPTYNEMEELANECMWEWIKQNGVNGYKVTGPNGNSIFLPATGYRDGSSLYLAGSYCFYWSSTPFESGSNYAYSLYFGSDSHYMDSRYRSLGRSVRPVLE